MVVRRWMAPAAMVLVAAGLSTLGHGTADAAPVARPATHDRAGSSWQKISSGQIGITYQSSLYRTSDGVLHVVYPKLTGGGDTVQLGHTAIDADGTIALQNNILPTDWATIDPSPIIIGDAGGGLRVLAGGQATSGYWADGRMYTMTAPASGTPWTVPAEAVGIDPEAHGSYGTAATSLADGTPVAAFPLNNTITWHTGTSDATPDQSFDVDACCTYYMNMVRDGDDVWISWYANGGSAATNGTFVRQIAPTLGPIMKAPQSSQGASSSDTGRTALVARDGGGVFAAYCTGYPYCDHIGIWKVGSDKVLKVPGTKYAALMSLSPGPSGRIWLAWSDNIPTIHALRTNIAGTKVGPARKVGMPSGKASVYAVAINGTTARGDVVINVGDAFWHAQVTAGLTLRAKPGKWVHGKKTKVTFTVSDAGDAVSGASVKVGAKHCTTAATGKCAITFPKTTKAGQLVAKASKSGYGAGSTRLTVK